jgi:segregation and condensation protein B
LDSYEPLWEPGGDLPGALEALLVSSGEVLDLARLRELTGLGEGILRQGLDKLQDRLVPPRGLRLLEVGGGWRMAAAPEYQTLVAKLVETLAIVAYRQPVTMPEINELRGVTSCSNQMKLLLERELILPVGRKPVVGRPMMYATSLKFLLHFGLKSLADLPRLGDFGEGNLEALALARLEPPELPASGGLFDGLDDLPGTDEDSMTGLEEAPHD